MVSLSSQNVQSRKHAITNHGINSLIGMNTVDCGSTWEVLATWLLQWLAHVIHSFTYSSVKHLLNASSTCQREYITHSQVEETHAQCWDIERLRWRVVNRKEARSWRQSVLARSYCSYPITRKEKLVWVRGMSQPCLWPVKEDIAIFPQETPNVAWKNPHYWAFYSVSSPTIAHAGFSIRKC